VNRRKTGTWNGDQIIDMIVSQPQCARFIAAKIWKFFAYEPTDPKLNDFGAALSAFCDDLKRKGIFDRVVVMTFSEFGRRVTENANGGTDHGTAAPLFVCGGGVKPGLYGKQPALDKLDAGDLLYSVDSRSVYSTVLLNWMRAPAAKILGREFPKLNFV
jgi:uncharacterized protein (DUF1501 family)